MATPKQRSIIARPIEETILLIRGKRVILDEDLAAAYQVPTKALNQAVKRNLCRFPEDFMFQLTREEHEVLEVTVCDLKIQVGRQAVPALRVHRARGGDGGEPPELGPRH
jgi:hypothetical protein